MTVEQVVETYGECLLEFREYYKFVFTYIYHDTNNEITVQADFGGHSDDIYRHTVTHDDKIKLGVFESECRFCPWENGWSFVQVSNRSEILYEYSNF